MHKEDFLKIKKEDIIFNEHKKVFVEVSNIGYVDSRGLHFVVDGNGRSHGINDIRFACEKEICQFVIDNYSKKILEEQYKYLKTNNLFGEQDVSGLKKYWILENIKGEKNSFIKTNSEGCLYEVVNHTLLCRQNIVVGTPLANKYFIYPTRSYFETKIYASKSKLEQEIFKRSLSQTKTIIEKQNLDKVQSYSNLSTKPNPGILTLTIENDCMQKTTGQKLTEVEAKSLKPGDVYVVKEDGTKFWLRRVFKRLSVKSSKKVVSECGKVASFDEIRWPTTEEFEWMKRNQATRISQPSVQVSTYDTVCDKVKNNQTTKNNSQKQESVDMKMANGMVCGSNGSKMERAVESLKTDGSDALWRVLARQAVRSFKAPLTALLTSKNLPAGVVGLVLAQLDTDNGEALLAFVLGHGLTYMPQFGSDPKFVRLAKELRVMGMETFLSKVADVMLNPLREQLTDLLKGVPVPNLDNAPAE